MKKYIKNQKGFLLIEIVLAVALFGLIAIIVLSSFIYGRNSTDTAGSSYRASEIANEAMEALSNISQSSYTTIGSYTKGTNYYLVNTASQWSLTTTPTVIDSIYTATVVFSNGPTVTSTQATVTVTWAETPLKTGSVSATTYLSDWQVATTIQVKTGLLVYANGGDNSQLIDYRQITSNGAWTNPAPLPAISPSNAVAREVKIYAAQTGETKAVLARMYDGTNQYLVGYIWNGSSWSSGQILGQWKSGINLDIGNFSGAYMTNGTFVAIYSDSTNVPKYNTWNGSSWSAQGVLPQISNGNGDYPSSIQAEARPGYNEVMISVLGNNYETDTDLYTNNSWSNVTPHATSGNSNDSRLVDFAWSPVNPAQGALAFTDSYNQRAVNFRIFTDTGGTGTWGPVLTSNQQPSGSNPISLDIEGQPTGTELWESCDKDNSSTQSTYCYTLTPSGGISYPANNLINSSANIGTQQSAEMGFEQASGTTAINAYSNSTDNAQIKLFNSTGNSWTTTPISLPTAANTIEKTHVVPEPSQNDIMVLAIDNNDNLYSVMFNGTTSGLYTQPAGYAWTIHNANGPSIGAKWFDFAWDN